MDLAGDTGTSLRRSLPRHGQGFIRIVFSLVILLVLLTLAAAWGLTHLVKSRLNETIDAAVVAGTLATSQGETEADRKNNGTAAAKKLFNAKFPNGHLGATVALDDPLITFDNGLVTVDMSAQAVLPVDLVDGKKFKLLDIEAVARSVRKDLDLALVVDTSGSLRDVAGTVRRQVSAFLDKLHPATDRVALVHFATGAVVDVPMSQKRGFNRELMKSRIAGYRFDGRTNSSEGFRQGWNELNNIDAGNRSATRAIVFFSDGSPNAFASRFNFKDARCRNAVGVLATIDAGDLKYRKADGLHIHNRQDEKDENSPAGCYLGPKSENDPGVAALLHNQGLPEWYNAHGDTTTFKVVTGPNANGRRAVLNDTSNAVETWRNVNRAARNLAEDMAEQARKEGIRVFTLGLGSELHQPGAASDIPDDTGENLLKCMANTMDAPQRCRRSEQPTGMYCHAAKPQDLEPCFASLAAEILRITR